MFCDVTLEVAVVMLAAAEGDSEHAVGSGGKHERELVLDAEWLVELLIEREAVQLGGGDHVGEAVGTSVARSQITVEERVLVCVLCEALVVVRSEVGAHDHRDGVGRRSDLVQGDVLRGECAVQRVEQAVAKLGDVEQAADVRDESEYLGFSVLAHLASA